MDLSAKTSLDMREESVESQWNCPQPPRHLCEALVLWVCRDPGSYSCWGALPRKLCWKYLFLSQLMVKKRWIVLPCRHSWALCTQLRSWIFWGTITEIPCCHAEDCTQSLIKLEKIYFEVWQTMPCRWRKPWLPYPWGRTLSSFDIEIAQRITIYESLKFCHLTSK